MGRCRLGPVYVCVCLFVFWATYACVHRLLLRNFVQRNIFRVMRVKIMTVMKPCAGGYAFEIMKVYVSKS
jgi:hypothetical protein